MDIWQVVGFFLIVWWVVSTIVRNNRYFRALKAEGKSVMPDLGPFFSLIFLPLAFRREEKKWVDRTLEQKNNRQGAQ